MRSAADHLTEEQLMDVLVTGEISTACRVHLAACETCTSRMAKESEDFRSSVGDFSRASLLWSESQPASPSQTAAATPRQPLAAPLGWAFAAAALLIVASPLRHNDYWHSAAPVNSVAHTSEVSEEQIVEDNRLLQSVNVALAETDPSPFEEYRLSPGQTQRARPHAGGRRQ